MTDNDAEELLEVAPPPPPNEREDNTTPTTATTEGEDNTATETNSVSVFLPTDLHPTAKGTIACLLKAKEKTQQRAQADELYNFLQSADPALARLNESSKCYVGVISIPKTKFVRVVYGFGFGTTPIGAETAPTDGQLLLLHGEGDADIGPPLPLCLPASTVKTERVATMTNEQVAELLQRAGARYSYPLLQRRRVVTSANIMQIAPLPAYLACDGFESDIDAACLLERTKNDAFASSAGGKHLQDFLRACLSNHNSGDTKPYVRDEALLRTAPVCARQWAKDTFNKLFPTLHQASELATAAAPTQPSQPASQDLAYLIAAITSATANANASAVTTAATTTQDQGKLMSAGELQTLLRMCGEDVNGTLDELPTWVRECADKGNSEAFKIMLLQKHIMATEYYDDAEVPLTVPLLKMVVKRAWTGKDGNITRPSLLHAMDGLTPFAMLDLNEDQVAMLNEEQDLLNSASLVSVVDLRGQRSKIKISIPVEPEEFMLMLKRYANLLFALFSDSSPMFNAMVAIISALRDLSREARRQMTLATKGSILWIILLQSRQFALGKVNLLCEFTTMHEDLRAKRASILHSEMPRELLTNSEVDAPKGKPSAEAGTHNEAIDVDKIPKRPKMANPNKWHPKLKEKLEEPLKAAGFPSFTKIMNFCKQDAYSIFPKGSAICVPNAFFGRCFHGEKCTRKHTLPKDSQIEVMLKMVDDFIKDPAKLKSGQ